MKWRLILALSLFTTNTVEKHYQVVAGYSSKEVVVNRGERTTSEPSRCGTLPMIATATTERDERRQNEVGRE